MKNLFRRIAGWFRSQEDEAWISSLSPAGLSDIGMTRDEGLRLVRGHEGSRERLEAMAARYGLEADEIGQNRQDAIDIAINCGECVNDKLCERYLAGNEAADPDAFCPNASRYRDLKTLH
ncbi:MAG: DUF6455 family protein [Rhizobiaceae bacterium]